MTKGELARLKKVENDLDTEEDAFLFHQQSSRPPPISNLRTQGVQQQSRETCSNPMTGRNFQEQPAEDRPPHQTQMLESEPQPANSEPSSSSNFSPLPKESLNSATLDLQKRAEQTEKNEAACFSVVPAQTTPVRAIRKLFVGRLPPEATRGT